MNEASRDNVNWRDGQGMIDNVYTAWVCVCLEAMTLLCTDTLH